MFIEDLTDVDYRILDFVNKNEPIKLEDIKSALIDIDSLDYRINLLSTPIHRQSGLIMQNTCFLINEYENVKSENGLYISKPLNIYSLTDLGKKALQDYKVNNIKYKKELWLKNAWIPIMVSIITTLITIELKDLWPHIKEWLMCILS